ncbi:uncharacterized protein MONOS_16904 [Monocercomonoides exilis]|uniref:uncharacterized protein n=1 Tax=Monocercomonoides exilis TaxID=2049356 RepID=UPI00355A9D36|nr:hypothetical protein MONOS_16904 [Monocercomonoides exilis]
MCTVGSKVGRKWGGGGCVSSCGVFKRGAGCGGAGRVKRIRVRAGEGGKGSGKIQLDISNFAEKEKKKGGLLAGPLWQGKQQQRWLVQPKEMEETKRKNKVWSGCSESIKRIEGGAGEESGEEGRRFAMEMKKGMEDVGREKRRGSVGFGKRKKSHVTLSGH